jgi:hypothetical protein
MCKNTLKFSKKIGGYPEKPRRCDMEQTGQTKGQAKKNGKKV